MTRWPIYPAEHNQEPLLSATPIPSTDVLAKALTKANALTT